MKDVYEALMVPLNEAGEGFFVVEGERILLANEACSKISGYGLAELSALPSLRGLFVPEDVELLLDSPPAVERRETATAHKSGRRVEVDVTVNPLRGGGSRRVVFRDVTERKHAAGKIRFQSRLL